jgi:hypothetical protein
MKIPLKKSIMLWSALRKLFQRSGEHTLIFNQFRLARQALVFNLFCQAQQALVFNQFCQAQQTLVLSI